jgi:hypothetical protein
MRQSGTILLTNRNRTDKQAYCSSITSRQDERRPQKGSEQMKKTTVLAIALGLGALAACKQSPQEQTADNIEANAENTADTIEANAENASDTMQANAENAADTVRNEGENKADAVRNSSDADGNSAH